ncbi:MAG: hypothetical protein KDD39_13950, partial [Bdellovibrionales bacterium]|nr:hypothetical protein [Bdellovibrionales bacterium]
MKNFSWIFILALSLSYPILADKNEHETPDTRHPVSPKESCTVEALTRNCEVFSEDAPLSIDLPDGTIIPNHAARGKLRSTSPEEAAEEAIEQRKNNIKFMKELFAKKAKWQAETLAWLKKINKDNKLFSETFENYLAAHMNGAVNDIFDERPTGMVFLPWPPDKEGADVETVPSREALAKLKEILGKEFETFDSLTLEAERLAKSHAQPARTSKTDKIEKMESDNRSRIGKRLDHGKALFAKVQGAMEKKLLNGRKYEELSDHEKSLIDRIKSVTFNYTEDPGSCSGIPNAFYRKNDHSINVCTGFLLDPDASLTLLLGHELAHAIDPCTSQFPLLNAKKDNFLKWVDTANNVFNADARAKPEFLPLFRYLDSGFGRLGKDHLISYPLALDFGQDAVDFLANHPDKPSLETKAPGIPASEYPFKSVIECLGDEKHDFKSTKTAVHDDSLARVRKYRKEFLGIDDPASEKRIVEVLKKHPECGVGGSHSEMGEAFADWMGADILAELMDSTPLEKFEDRLAPFASFAQWACEELARGKG